jgi:hypothetical protein
MAAAKLSIPMCMNSLLGYWIGLRIVRSGHKEFACHAITSR